MTENHIKEKLSNSFIGILAANKGYMIDKPELDYGCDFILARNITYSLPNGGTRYLRDSKYIAVQMKSTTENGITENATHVKYDLEGKTFNDLVQINSNGIAPFILILFILPSNRIDWVEINDANILLKKCAYWYIPPVGAIQTDNNSTIRIDIPKQNILGIDCFDNLFATHY